MKLSVLMLASTVSQAALGD
jgi:hypothetical protein